MIRAIILLMISMLSLTACSSKGTPVAADSALRADQQAALERLDRCIQNQSDSLRDEGLRALAQIAEVCEGHRRDLVALYPPQFDARVNALLQTHLQQRSLQLLNLDGEPTRVLHGLGLQSAQ